MQRVCHIDFETRSFADLKSLGLYRYAMDPTTEILCMAYMFDDDETPSLWLPFDPFPDSLKCHIENGDCLAAHNANFERVIWEYVAQRIFADWPTIRLEQWICTAAMTSASGLPKSLDVSSRLLGLAEKDAGGYKIMLKLSKPRGGKFIGDPEDFEQLYSYCKQDVVVESQIYNTLTPLIPFEQRVWCTDQKVNDRGVMVDVPSVRRAVTELKKAEKECKKQITELTNGEITSFTTVQQILKWVNARGANLDSLDKKYLASIDMQSLPQEVQGVIQVRLDAGKASTKKFQKMLDQVTAGDRIRGLHIYHGAHTGRWAGQLVQTQNMIRASHNEASKVVELLNNPALDFAQTIANTGGHPIVELSKISRTVLVAPPGRKFIAGDFKQVEARGIFWLAGDKTMCEKMAGGCDIYVEEAAKIYNMRKEDIGDKSVERFVGKWSVLGDGYGMGWWKFQHQLKGFGIEVSPEIAQKAIDTYRYEHPLVPALWDELERAIARAMMYENESVDVQGKVSFVKRGDWLLCRLPSRRELRYFKPEMHMITTPWGEDKLQLTYIGKDLKGKWSRIHTYGGKMAENIDSAICRDLFAYALVRAEDAGLCPVLLVHDEIVCEVDENEKLQTLLDLMNERPPWALDFPLATSGWEGKCFRKD